MNKTAVLCDDDQTLTQIMQFVLSKQGFDVRTAENGNEALALMKFSKPGLLLLDLEMPERDGFSVLREIASGPDRPYTIILSSHESQDIHDQAVALGAREVWVKPFNAAELMTKISGLLEQGRAAI